VSVSVFGATGMVGQGVARDIGALDVKG